LSQRKRSSGGDKRGDGKDGNLHLVRPLWVDFGAEAPRAGGNAHFFEWGASYLAAKSLVKADLVNGYCQSGEFLRKRAWP
jgi:hypothetical protein